MQKAIVIKKSEGYIPRKIFPEHHNSKICIRV